MLFQSTRGNSKKVSFKEALFNGLAPDGGLYLPVELPALGKEFFEDAAQCSYHELASQMIMPFVSEDISESDLRNICESAFTFEVPMVNLNEQIAILELFHGPTLAFKDFAARFMARTMEYFLEEEEKYLTVLVATSGDTGSAVANGFYGLETVSVVILYPSGRVSRIQEQQLTTLGGNVTALEVDGSFDDCQQMVKNAFQDYELRKELPLSSANSINVGRLLPQSVYYAWAWSKAGGDEPVVFSVPCGNFGNLTAGVIAQRMGLPVERFIAATNANDVFPKFLESGEYHPQQSQETISNAMDVGKPSNLERITSLFGDDIDSIREEISSWSFSDKETIETIRDTYTHYGYSADPHTAVGILGMEKFMKENASNAKGIVLSTAHPAKFPDLVEQATGVTLPIPDMIQRALEKEKQSIPMTNSYFDLKEFLLSI